MQRLDTAKATALLGGSASFREVPGRVLDALPQRIFWIDGDGVLQGCNRAFAGSRGFATADALIAAAAAGAPSTSDAAWLDDLAALASGEDADDREECRTLPDGTARWARCTRTPLLDDEGRLVGMVGTEEDVTDRKDAEAALRESSSLLDMLLANTPDYVYFKDMKSRFVRYSHRFVQLLGLSDPEALKGKSDFDLFTDEHALAAYEDEQRIIETGRPLVGKLEKETYIGGRVGWALTSKLPWRDADGAIVGTFGISKDVTELKEAESRLESAHHRLVETSRLAGMAEVATDVLHNVGNVLNSVNVSSTLMMDQIKGSKADGLTKLAELLAAQGEGLGDFFSNDPRGPRIPGYLTALSGQLGAERTSLTARLDQLQKHIDHIKQIVEMQQSYAKVAGVLESVSPRQLLDDALAMNGAALTRHRIQTRVEIEEVGEIVTDKHKVLQILVNLIRNAKYAVDEAAGQERFVTLRVIGTEDSVCFEVADTGVGIQAENLTRIFCHGFTTRRGGHGFGLHSGALAAKELKGSLVGHSDGPGKGAVFTLTLPRDPPSRSDEAPAGAAGEISPCDVLPA